MSYRDTSKLAAEVSKLFLAEGKKHLGRYVDEFAFRLNEGNVQRHTLERLDSFVSNVVGKRLTYSDLIH